MMQRHVGIRHNNPPKSKNTYYRKKTKGRKPRAFMKRI